MGRVNQLWQDEREARALKLVHAGMDPQDAWEGAGECPICGRTLAKLPCSTCAYSGEKW